MKEDGHLRRKTTIDFGTLLGKQMDKNKKTVLDYNVSGKDLIGALWGVLGFFSVLVIFSSSFSGVAFKSVTVNKVPDKVSQNVIAPGPSGALTSWASMEFQITNSTPSWDNNFIVNSIEVAYFNVTNYYNYVDVFPPSVSLYANVSGVPGGEVLKKVGPYDFSNGTTSNGIQYETFLAEVEMVNYAMTNAGTGPNTYTNITVEYKVMGNGNIYIEYWISYNNNLGAEVNNWMNITNTHEVYTKSGD